MGAGGAQAQKMLQGRGMRKELWAGGGVTRRGSMSRM